MTIDRIANAICQDTTFKGTYVLVEGNNDFTLFRKFFKNEVCDVKISFGKDIIEGVIEILEQRGYENTIGILDSDFHNLNTTKPKNQNLFFTDTHDLETLILQSDAIEILLDQYSIKEKVEDFLEENGDKDIRKVLLNLISPLGYLKWANQENQWGIIFKPKDIDAPELKIEDFIPPATIKFSGNKKMVNTVFNFARGKVKKLPEEDVVLKHLEEKCKEEVDKYQLCNGHDVAYLLSLTLRKKIANLNSKAVSAKQIESDLILAYDSRFFEQTNLYTEIKKWEVKSNIEILKF